jgi:hypothetical protein
MNDQIKYGDRQSLDHPPLLMPSYLAENQQLVPRVSPVIAMWTLLVRIPFQPVIPEPEFGSPAGNPGECFELISLARPIMEDIYQAVRSGTVIALVNSAICLGILGNSVWSIESAIQVF